MTKGRKGPGRSFTDKTCFYNKASVGRSIWAGWPCEPGNQKMPAPLAAAYGARQLHIAPLQISIAAPSALTILFGDLSHIKSESWIHRSRDSN